MQLITTRYLRVTGWVRAPIDSCPAFDRRPAVLILPGGGYEYCSQREGRTGGHAVFGRRLPGLCAGIFPPRSTPPTGSQ